MTGDEEVTIIARPDNIHDIHACEILADDKPIGWIAKGKNQELSALLQAKQKVYIDDYNITGGDEGKNYGCNIHIVLPASKKLKNLEKLIPTIGEGEVYFDKENHVYYDEDGNQMISGSKFEEEQTGKPDLSYAAESIAHTTGIPAAVITDLWDMNGELSRDFGTLVHKALEFYISNQDVLKDYDNMKERPHGAANWMSYTLSVIVDKYVEEYDTSNALCEVFVRHGNWCGYIDQLKYTSDKTVEIRDYKVINKSSVKTVKTQDYGSLPKYTLQQNFYRTILEANGYKVDDMVLHIYSRDKWYQRKVPTVRLELP
jgi:hypothetical protein